MNQTSKTPNQGPKLQNAKALERPPAPKPAFPAFMNDLATERLDLTRDRDTARDFSV